MRRTLRAAAVAGAATAIAIVGVATASAGTKIENLSLVSTSTSGAYSAIATGAFTDGGIAITQDNLGTLRLQKGTIKLTLKAGKGSQSINLRTCLATATQPGTYKVTSGTGAYKRITGSGSYVERVSEVGRIVKGKCSRIANPVAVQDSITAHGPVTLP